MVLQLNHLKENTRCFQLTKYTFKSTTPLPHYICQNISKSCKILDVGCGKGRTIKFLKKNGFTNVIGIEPLHENTELGITRTGFEEYQTNKKFDVVILMGLLSLIERDKRQKFIDKAKSMLNEKGIIFLEDFGLTWNVRNLKRYLSKLWRFDFGTFNLQGVEIHHFTKDELTGLFSGFEVKIFEKTTFKTMHGNTCNGYLIIGGLNGN